MTRTILSKMIGEARATALAVGVAVVLAATLGAATTALAAVPGDPFKVGQLNAVNAVSRLVGEVDGPILMVDNDYAGQRATALPLQAKRARPPLKVNAASGTATNLSADELDGKDSNQILPLARSQKDPTPLLSDTVTGMSAQTNSVSISAPTDGVLIVFGNVWLYNPSTAEQSFSAHIRLDGEEETHTDASNVDPSRSAGLAPNVTLTVSAGQHTVSLEAVRSGGSGNWSYTSNNLSVVFVPGERGVVTNVGS
jgi:hypothetical protein